MGKNFLKNTFNFVTPKSELLKNQVPLFENNISKEHLGMAEAPLRANPLLPA